MLIGNHIFSGAVFCFASLRRNCVFEADKISGFRSVCRLSAATSIKFSLSEEFLEKT